MAKKKCPECPKGAAKWMTTFSDMTTLLLTFFVLLLTMANFDKAKIEMIFGIFGGSRGILNHQSTNPLTEQIIHARKSLEQSMQKVEEKVEKKMKEFVNAQNIEKMVSIIKTEKGISIRIMDSILFEHGASEVSPAAYPILDKLIILLEDSPHNVNIEGHTDDSPWQGVTGSNWDLSVQRALSVLKYFLSKKFDPARLSASGYGEYHPILPNITPENRAKNRRVEINVISPELAESGRSVFEEE